MHLVIELQVSLCFVSGWTARTCILFDKLFALIADPTTGDAMYSFPSSGANVFYWSVIVSGMGLQFDIVQSL